MAFGENQRLLPIWRFHFSHWKLFFWGWELSFGSFEATKALWIALKQVPWNPEKLIMKVFFGVVKHKVCVRNCGKGPNTLRPLRNQTFLVKTLHFDEYPTILEKRYYGVEGQQSWSAFPMAQRLERLPTLLQAFQASSLPFLRQPTNTSPTIVPRWASKCASIINPLISVPVTIRLPSFLSEIWDSVLRAVPKKKTSHSKKRHRQLAGKALKDVTNLNRCSACGRIKRAYVLCPYCVQCKCQ